MINTLRFIGLMNAAMWLGAALFYLLVVDQTFASEEMARLLTDPYAHAASLLIAKRFYLLNTLCGFVAAAHLTAEWLYFGRNYPKAQVGLLISLLFLGIVWGGAVHPKTQELHRKAHLSTDPVLRVNAAKSYKMYRGVTWLYHLFLVGGTGVCFWSLVNQKEGQRTAFRLHKVRS